MRSGITPMSTPFLEMMNREYRKFVWGQMMVGNADGWLEFFRAIGKGSARLIIAENSRLPRA